MDLKTRSILALFATLCVSVATAAQLPAGRNAAEQQVLDFVTAFNQQDVDAMLTLTSTDITWMSISGATLGMETSGADELGSSMRDYFSSHPDSFSKILQIQSSGSWVTTLEHAGRVIEGQFRGQCAYAMYQLSDNLIKSVWYFDAHPCDQR